MARTKLPKVDDLSIADLSQLMINVQGALDAKRKLAKTEFIEKMRADAEAQGFNLNDILGNGAGGRKKRADAGRKVPPRYIGPNGETYTGRGPTPKWLQELEAKGHKRERYAIK